MLYYIHMFIFAYILQEGSVYEREHVLYFLSEIVWPQLTLYILNPFTIYFPENM